MRVRRIIFVSSMLVLTGAQSQAQGTAEGDSMSSYAVIVDDNHIGQTSDIAETVGNLGFDVRRVIPEAGAIYGAGSSSTMEKLRKVPGVLEVRPEGGVRLPPAGSNGPQ